MLPIFREVSGSLLFQARNAGAQSLRLVVTALWSAAFGLYVAVEVCKAAKSLLGGGLRRLSNRTGLDDPRKVLPLVPQNFAKHLGRMFTK